MNRRLALRALAALSALPALPAQAAAPAHVHVFKSPSCGCCTGWIDHLKAAGFAVRVTDTHDTTQARKRLGMPDAFGSCHTATVGGYVIEGHVPATQIRRLLAQKQNALGLAVPSMPVGSPGMEMGSRRDPYDVLLVDRKGRASVFASYPQ